MPDRNFLHIEALIAMAHRNLVQAALVAEPMRDQGLSDDLRQIAIELERLQIDLLKSARRPRMGERGRA